MSSHLSLTGLLPSAKKSAPRMPSLDHRHHHHHRTNRRPMATTITGGGSLGSHTNPAVTTGIRAITNKAPLTIRPFAAIYNPYAKGCSVLCNHPATPEIKNVVKHAKQSWKHEPGHHPDNQQQPKHYPPDLLRHVGNGRDGSTGNRSGGGGVKHDVTKYGTGKLIKIMEYGDVNEVPEEFLRRFTDTDSRPMTPTPTVLSNKTRTSHHSGSMVRSRRCFTPEPENVYAREKKSIILDLRRSHSQETVFWNASSEFSAGRDTTTGMGSVSGSCRRPVKTTTTTASVNNRVGVSGDGKKVAKRNEAAVGATSPAPSLKPQTRGTSASSQSHLGEGGVGVNGGGDADELQRNQLQKQLSCIYAKDDLDEEPRRRGKKKKRGKGHPETSTTFRPSQDPETQVATVPPDSTTQSQRPSIVANGGATSMLGNQADRSALPRGSKTSSDDFREALGRMSFLDESLLSQLRRGLSIEAIETNFQIMMQRALKEAFKGMPLEVMNSGTSGGGAAGSAANHGGSGRGSGNAAAGSGGSLPQSAGGGTGVSRSSEPDSVRGVKEALNLPHINHDKWLTLPRKYTRMVSRFELPIDSTELSHLSPLQYLSKYVQVSNYRKQLYHRIFVKYIPEIKLDDFGEINLPDWNPAAAGGGRAPPPPSTMLGLPSNATSSPSASVTTSLINHGVSTTMTTQTAADVPSCADSALSISELYMSQRFIPRDQLKTALTTVLCPSASAEIIENVLEILQLTKYDEQRQQQEREEDATEKYDYRGSRARTTRGEGRVEEIARNSSATARERNAIAINMSTSSSSVLCPNAASPFLSAAPAADYVPSNDVLQINRADGRNGKLNIFANSNHDDDDKKTAIRDAKIDGDKTSNDCNVNPSSSQLVDADNDLTTTTHQEKSVLFAGTAARIVATSSTAAQFATTGDSQDGGEEEQCRNAESSGSGMTTSFFPHSDPTRFPREAGGSVQPGGSDEFLTEEIKINFRTWCGIVAFAERFTTNIQKEDDSRHEIEITDFESLDRRINGLPIHPKLKQILYIIKN